MLDKVKEVCYPNYLSNIYYMYSIIYILFILQFPFYWKFIKLKVYTFVRYAHLSLRFELDSSFIYYS